MSYRNATLWMWADALEMLHRAERLQRQFFRLKEAESRAVWEPPVDLVESANGIDVAIALPGINPERLKVGFEEGALVIEAVRPLPALAEHNVIHRLEIPYGRFARRVSLPPGKYALVEQAMSNGCLHVRLRKQS
jgi:HSP20 family molecular chaperone IbpA